MVLPYHLKNIGYTQFDIIIAVDDSLTVGVSDNVEIEFDRTRIRALQEYGKSFTYVVMGLVCDGESIMEMPQVSLKWLIIGIVFYGINFTGKYKKINL